LARIGHTISSRITLGVLALQIIILPTLYFGLVYLLKENNEETFLNSSRGHARYLADSLERISDPYLESEVIEILDSVVVSGDGVFSELAGPDGTILSSLVTQNDADRYIEDFQIGDHNDNTYYISVPVIAQHGAYTLRVGFDETPYLERNAAAYKNGSFIILAYLAALLLLLPVIGGRITRPIKNLQQASKEVASGAVSERLLVESDLVELVDLARDLDQMKQRLVGTSQQLEQEIEERKEAESERRNLEIQLRHSQRLETVGTMAGGIAHELNNILVPIILYTDIAIEDLPAGSSAAKSLERVLASAIRAKGIVSQVLTFGHRIENGDLMPIDMAAVVRESIELVRASIPRAVTLDYEIANDCPAVLASASLLNQLTLNLYNNAFQSLADENGTVFISLARTRADSELAVLYPALVDRDLVRLCVTDNGQGMNEETMQRIFEPFFTTRSVGDGTGLGLSVVHGIVTDLNGAIRVQSTLESGSTFSVYLPAYVDESVTSDHPA
jgi:signal transduction histidine kinase